MKHTRKRLTALLLTLSMVLALAIPAYAAEDNWWEQYVTSPMEDWSIDGVTDGHVTSHGRYVLVTSDTHRYTYLAKNLLANANAVIAADGETGNVGLMCFGGDFANEYTLYDDNMSIVKAALQTSDGTVATYTKGNHEGSVTDEEFQAKTGMSRIGETAVNAEGYYHFFNFGALNKTQQFTNDDIAQLKAYLEKPEVSEDGKPIIIVSHYPLHYYNDRRSSKQADQVLDILNNYPQAIFLWGHNHTEQDPNYGMIRVPGDIIQTGASVDSTKEIKFTYACLGALRDGINEANGLLMKVNGDGSTTFRYIGLHASPSSTESWTDAQGNENPVRITSNEKVSSNNTYVTPTEDTYKTISLANVQIARPLVDQKPAEAPAVFSPRFTSSAIAWTANGADVTGKFDFDTTYTATFTLTAAEGYAFANPATVSINKEYVGPAPGAKNHEAESVVVSEDGKTATVTYTFPVTTAEGTPADAAELEEGGMYVMAAIDSNFAASYLYDPAQHGEESMPDYTAASADVVIREGKLVSETSDSMVFTAQKDADGYLLWSDASLKDGNGATTLNFLSMSTRGGDLGLEAAETAGMAIYNNWNTENGVPYLNIDGAKEYAAYQNGKFCYVSDPAESNVRLFKVGTNSGSTIYNVSATVAAPVPGEAPAETANVIPGCTVESVKWDAASFDYETAYIVTLTLKVGEGYTVSDVLTARVNGAAADITAADGKLTVTYTFPETTSIPGAKIGLQAKAADALKEGREYVISAGDLALSAASAQGIYLAAVSKEDGLTSDMVFTAVGNDADGYALKTGDQYLAGRPVDDSPDKWGFMLTDKPSGAVTFMYQDGKMKVVSTGASGGPGGPPPAANDSYLYLNGDHFNFGTLQSTELTILELYFPFTDVAEERWSYDEIYDMAATGIMLGVNQTTFAPKETMTRAMAITVLYRMAGEPEVSGIADYKDVRQNAFYTKALIWGTECGIVNGFHDGTYRPGDPVNRQQFAAMIHRFVNYLEIETELGDGVTFTDADSIGAYAKEAVDFCTKAGIINGYKDGSFQPTSAITREEAAAMLSRLIDLF